MTNLVGDARDILRIISLFGRHIETKKIYTSPIIYFLVTFTVVMLLNFTVPANTLAQFPDLKPLPLPSIAKIRCPDGTLTEMVSDCPTVDACKSLVILNSTLLECTNLSLDNNQNSDIFG
jgi:hypothetical protein